MAPSDFFTKEIQRNLDRTEEYYNMDFMEPIIMYGHHQFEDETCISASCASPHLREEVHSIFRNYSRIPTEIQAIPFARPLFMVYCTDDQNPEHFSDEDSISKRRKTDNISPRSTVSKENTILLQDPLAECKKNGFELSFPS